MSEASLHRVPRRIETGVDRVCATCKRLVGRVVVIEQRRSRVAYALMTRLARARRRPAPPRFRERQRVIGSTHGRCRTCYPKG